MREILRKKSTFLAAWIAHEMYIWWLIWSYLLHGLSIWNSVRRRNFVLFFFSKNNFNLHFPMKKSVAYSRKFECKLKRKKLNAGVFTNFPPWISLLRKRKKWLLREKNVRHPRNFVRAWNLMSHAEQPWGWGRKCPTSHRNFGNIISI